MCFRTNNKALELDENEINSLQIFRMKNTEGINSKLYL